MNTPLLWSPQKHLKALSKSHVHDFPQVIYEGSIVAQIGKFWSNKYNLVRITKLVVVVRRFNCLYL